MQTHQSQSGFSPLHVLLLLVLVGIVGFTGWKVYDTGKSTKPADSSTSAPVTKKEEPKPEVPKIPDGFVEYENKELGFKFAYPKEWGDAKLTARVAEAKANGCIKQVEPDKINITGEVYHVTFTGNPSKKLLTQTKDYNFDHYLPCITLEGVIGPHFYEGVKGTGFSKDAESEYIAATDNYECGLENYYLYAVKPLSTAKINGVSMTLHSFKNPYVDKDCLERPELIEQARATLNAEDKQVMSTFKAL